MKKNKLQKKIKIAAWWTIGLGLLQLLGLFSAIFPQDDCCCMDCGAQLFSLAWMGIVFGLILLVLSGVLLLKKKKDRLEYSINFSYCFSRNFFIFYF